MTSVASLPRSLLGRLTGPIFEKQLRVASRRKRAYALRLGYPVLLTAIVASVWVEIGNVRGASMASRASRMAEIGKNLTLTIAWSQFIATHLIAVVMISNAVAGEIRQRTMESLLTTSITSYQFVLGKLLSSLTELVLFPVLSVPFLAIRRLCQARTFRARSSLMTSPRLRAARTARRNSLPRTRCGKERRGAIGCV